MRTTIVLCLVLMIALSFGCSKKKEAPKAEAAPTAEMNQEIPYHSTPTASYDPVTKEEVDIDASPFFFEFNGLGYYFASAENMEAFKADPEKYTNITRAETPQTAPPQGQ